MPNWCFNTIYFKKSDKDKFLKMNDDGKEIIDYGIIIPMPESIKNTNASTFSDSSLIYYLSDKLLLSVEETIKRYEEELKPLLKDSLAVFSPSDIKHRYDNCKKYISQELKIPDDEYCDMYELGKQLFDNVKEYGCVTWYDWSYTNWGVKWNASDTDIEENDNDTLCVRFESPWGPPEEWLARLANQGIHYYFEWWEEQGYRGFYYYDGIEFRTADMPLVVEAKGYGDYLEYIYAKTKHDKSNDEELNKLQHYSVEWDSDYGDMIATEDDDNGEYVLKDSYNKPFDVMEEYYEKWHDKFAKKEETESI